MSDPQDFLDDLNTAIEPVVDWCAATAIYQRMNRVGEVSHDIHFQAIVESHEKRRAMYEESFENLLSLGMNDTLNKIAKQTYEEYLSGAPIPKKFLSHAIKAIVALFDAGGQEVIPRTLTPKKGAPFYSVSFPVRVPNDDYVAFCKKIFALPAIKFTSANPRGKKMKRKNPIMNEDRAMEAAVRVIEQTRHIPRAKFGQPEFDAVVRMYGKLAPRHAKNPAFIKTKKQEKLWEEATHRYLSEKSRRAARGETPIKSKWGYINAVYHKMFKSNPAPLRKEIMERAMKDAERHYGKPIHELNPRQTRRVFGLYAKHARASHKRK